MKKTLLLIVFLLCISKSNAQEKFLNLSNIDDLKKPETVIFFFKTDCPYCMQMKNTIDENTQIIDDLKSNYNIISVNISTNEGHDIAAKYNVYAVPTIIKSNQITNEYSTLKGFGSLNRFLTFINLKTKKNEID